MNDEPLTPEQEKAMLDLFEQASLNDYPNPDRIGCPGSEFLKQLASNRRSIKLSDRRLDHVTHCSPCFREFVSFREGLRRAKTTRRAVMTGVGALAAGVAIMVVQKPKPSDLDAFGYEPFEIDLLNYGKTRGVGVSPSLRTTNRFGLPRKPLNLVITLPFGSQEGKYEVQILRADGQPAGLSSSGSARLRAGKTTLELKMDLSRLSPDHYQLGIRRVPFDWMPVPVDIR
jgi:hypothetical protein